MKYFIVQELVGPQVYAERKERALELLCPNALQTLHELRVMFGPVTVNNWHAGGAYKESGLRDPDTKTGAKYSQHKYGRAFDCKFRGVTPHEVFTFILENRERFPLLTCLEDVQHTPTWLHFDTRYHTRGGIWIVKP